MLSFRMQTCVDLNSMDRARNECDWTAVSDTSVDLDLATLTMLLEGIDATATTKRKRYEHGITMRS